MSVGIWLFLRQLQRPITRMCLTKMKYFIPLNDSTHQDICQEIYCDWIWCQTYEILQFQKTVNLIQTDMNQFSIIEFSEKWLSKINFFQKFSKKIRKRNFFEKKISKKFFSKKIFEKKNFSKKNFEKILCVEKNISFYKIFESHFSQNEIFENWSMALGIWLFLRQLQRPITRICLTQMKNSMPLNDSTHQDIWREIYCD